MILMLPSCVLLLLGYLFYFFGLLSSDGRLWDRLGQKGPWEVALSKILVRAQLAAMSGWVPRGFTGLMFIFFQLWFAGCKRKRVGDGLGCVGWKVSKENKITRDPWQSLFTEHNLPLASVLNCHFTLHFHDLIKLI